jgi:hypothetical protein
MVVTKLCTKILTCITGGSGGCACTTLASSLGDENLNDLDFDKEHTIIANLKLKLELWCPSSKYLHDA